MRNGRRHARSSRLHRSRRHQRDERGFVLVWFALLIVVLLGVAAFAVDLGHAYFVAQQEQDAADVSALSAASYLPDNCANANPHAQAVASENGFTNGSGDTVVTAVNGAEGGSGCNSDPSLSPNQIRVTVKTSVPTWFAKAIGIDALTVSRSSTAEYDPPVQLGSPSNVFGEAPGCASCYQSNVWANVVGRNNRKVDGNAIFSGWCPTNTTNGSADNCPGTGLNNQDRDTDGMLLQISNPTLEPLNVELFDPGFIGDIPPGAQTCPDAVYPFCAGDQANLAALNSNSAPPLQTTYTLYPLDNLANPLGNLSVCSVTYPGYLTPPASANDVTTRSFHLWANFNADAGCGALNGSSYVLQVQSGDGLGLPSEQGSNNFSVAACGSCQPLQPSADPNVTVSAITKMSLSTNVPPNVPNAQPTFYLARVPSWARGQLLTLSFFDIGDISNAGGQPIPGTLSVTSLDATHGAGGPPVGEFSGCTFSHPDTRGNSSGDYLNGQTTPWDPNPPTDEWGSLTSMGGSCTAQVDLNPSANVSFWNGKWVTWQIPIPSDYTCNDKDTTKCWLQINYDFQNAQFHDTTTWTASLSGNPVRLTK